MIRDLLYLTGNRPNIMTSVCSCAHFQSCPIESHLSNFKHIFSYLKVTLNLGLWYPKSDCIDLVNFSDANSASCMVDSKSTSVICLSLFSLL